MRAIAFTAIAGLALTGCDADRSGLFSLSRPDPIADARAEAETPVADQIVSLSAEPTPAGLIVGAVALPPTQGHWDARLVRVPTDDPSVFLMEFRLLPPFEPRPAGTQPSREVLGGRFLTRRELAGIRTVAVRGLRNQRSIRRQ